MLITFEGTEGCGKSTQLKLLAGALTELNCSLAVFSTFEPGGDSFGQAIRQMVLHGENLDPITELMLFLADRAHHVNQVIRPQLESRHIVLCDRYIDSTICYQGYARGLDITLLRTLNQFVTNSLMPDLTLLFDLPVEVGLARRLQGQSDRLDNETLEFHQRVREGFLKEAALDPERFRIINADRSIEEVHQETVRIVNQAVINQQNKRDIP